MGDHLSKEEIEKRAKGVITVSTHELYEWIQIESLEWFEEDRASWDEPPRLLKPGKWTYLEDYQKKEGDRTYDVFRRDRGEEEPRWSFAYWNGNPIRLSKIKNEENALKILVYFFLHGIDKTGHWTAIFKQSIQFIKKPNVSVALLRYEPTGVAPRNLFGMFAVKYLDPAEFPAFLKAEPHYKTYTVALISMRSIPEKFIDRTQFPNEEFIQWAASDLLVDRHDNKGIAMDKWDAENQGGWLGKGLGEELVKHETPKYDNLEAKLTTLYVEKNAKKIEKEYDECVFV
jgi:hypothetical protein